MGFWLSPFGMTENSSARGFLCVHSKIARSRTVLPYPSGRPVVLSACAAERNRKPAHKARLPLDDAVNRRGVDVEGPDMALIDFPSRISSLAGSC